MTNSVARASLTKPAALAVPAIYAWLGLIVAAYLALGLAYARATPAWQAPDEPAHYNYVAHLATTGQLPILQPGDYPAGKVPIGPEVRPTDISGFRYEAHQPPLFYALGAVVFRLHPSMFALRALSLLFGAALLPVAFLCARLALPARPWLWLAIAAFVAFVPMHLFVAGAIENDTLADLVLSLLLLAYLADWPPLALGALAGLAAITKVTIYLPAILLLSLSLWRGRAGERMKAVIAGVVVCGWWFVRNGLTYGWTDILVQGRQAQVAGSQTHTGAFGLAQLGNFIATGFHSFWGQFGWMSIPLPERDYRALIAFTAVTAAGWLVVLIRREGFGIPGRAWIGFGVTWGGTVAGLLIYNLTFLQPQGRYLFPALIPIAVFYVCGIAALFPRRLQPAAVGVLSLALALFSTFALQHDLIRAFG